MRIVKSNVMLDEEYKNILVKEFATISSRDGVGEPLGWLCIITIFTAPHSKALIMISRIPTKEPSQVPCDISKKLIGLHFTEYNTHRTTRSTSGFISEEYIEANVVVYLKNSRVNGISEE